MEILVTRPLVSSLNYMTQFQDGKESQSSWAGASSLTLAGALILWYVSLTPKKIQK